MAKEVCFLVFIRDLNKSSEERPFQVSAVKSAGVGVRALISL